MHPKQSPEKEIFINVGNSRINENHLCALIRIVVQSPLLEGVEKWWHLYLEGFYFLYRG